MNRRLTFPFLVILVALLIYWMDKDFGPESPQQESEPEPSKTHIEDNDPSTPAHSGEMRRAGLEQAPQRKLAETRSDEVGLRMLTGWIVGPDNRAVADAWVLNLKENLTVRSEADGSFELELPEPITPRKPLSLWVWASGFQYITKQTGSAEPLHIRLEFDPGLEVQVQRMADAAPIAGAKARFYIKTSPGVSDLTVRGAWPEAPIPPQTSDSFGKLRIPGGSAMQVLFQAEGYDPSWLQGRHFVRGGRNQVVVQMRRARDIQVRCLDRKGRPLAGATFLFLPSGDTEQSDDEGWVTVPALARAYFTQVQVHAESVSWMFLPGVDEAGIRYPLQTGDEWLVQHFPRQGQVLIPPSMQDERFEVATCAVMERVGLEFLPHPQQAAEQLVWQTLTADGSFDVRQGWQGERTGLVVRRAGDRLPVLQKELVGPGPYRLEVPSQYSLTLDFVADPQAELENTLVYLERIHTNFGPSVPLPPMAIREGQIQLNVRPGQYRVQLQFADELRPRTLPLLRMPARVHTHQYDLGRLRKVTGRVVVAGQPLYPCKIRLKSTPASFDAGVWVDEQGHWQLRHVPTTALEFYVEPTDPWLSREGMAARIPAEQDFFAYELPVGLLTLSVANPATFDPNHYWIYRRPLEDDRRRLTGAGRVHLPDLSLGPHTLQMTPCRLVLGGQGFYRTIEPGELRVDADSVQALTLQARELGIVQVIRPGDTHGFQAEVNLEPLDVPELSGSSAFVPGVAHGQGFPAAEGRLIPANTVPAGRWRVTVRGPLIPLPWGGGRPKGPIGSPGDIWSIEIQVEVGHTTTVYLEGEPGAIQARAEPPSAN